MGLMMKMGAIGFPETSATNSHITLVKSKKSENLIYTTAEDGNHVANSTKFDIVTDQKTVATLHSHKPWGSQMSYTIEADSDTRRGRQNNSP